MLTIPKTHGIFRPVGIVPFMTLQMPQLKCSPHVYPTDHFPYLPLTLPRVEWVCYMSHARLLALICPHGPHCLLRASKAIMAHLLSFEQNDTKSPRSERTFQGAPPTEPTSTARCRSSEMTFLGPSKEIMSPFETSRAATGRGCGSNWHRWVVLFIYPFHPTNLSHIIPHQFPSFVMRTLTVSYSTQYTPENTEDSHTPPKNTGGTSFLRFHLSFQELI